jgi:hypothetical protein
VRIQATTAVGCILAAKSHSLRYAWGGKFFLNQNAGTVRLRLFHLKTLKLKRIAFGAAEQFSVEQFFLKMGSLSTANYSEALIRRFVFKKWLKSGASKRAPTTFK